MSKQVVIVGAGVVGCLIAKVLKKHDIPFKILEKNKEIFRTTVGVLNR